MKDSRLKDFLSFRTMITPVFIQIIFIIGVLIILIFSLYEIISGAGKRNGGDMILSGIITLILGPLVLRIYLEIIVVVFSINRSVLEIKRNTDSMAGTQLPPPQGGVPESPAAQ